jgi:uncharacterized protein
LSLIWRELIAALIIWPDRTGWWRTFKTAVPACVLIAFLAWVGGFLNSAPRYGDGNFMATLAISFFVPPLAEEIIFRGLLLSAAWRLTKRYAAWVTVIAFTLWHPFQAVAFGFAGSEVFLNPAFIIATFILGMVLSHVRIITRSLWPAIFLHWFVVACWKLSSINQLLASSP